MGANGQYVVQEERQEGACCSTWRRTACQAEGHVYQVSDNFYNFRDCLKLKFFSKKVEKIEKTFGVVIIFVTIRQKNGFFKQGPFLLHVLVELNIRQKKLFVI
jgi:hypothetical protein